MVLWPLPPMPVFRWTRPQSDFEAGTHFCTKGRTVPGPTREEGETIMRDVFVLLPDEAMPIDPVVLVIGVVAGLARPRLLLGFALLLALMPLIGHLFEAFLTAMPLWFALFVVGTLMMWMARAALSVLIGREAAARALGTLAVDVIKTAFRASVLPFRVVGGCCGGGTRDE